ncbi:hypothetical protein GOD90_16895 [Sinorhizobium medicae]|uniref:Uncharacterized protein n=1 Tax=Sinorhizobium medicae (strain WSM419) TaxID=366394 RepID=A6U8S3_SINMW|nr:hypothetical protein Smed_1203 [Sinorhizobium medicae WSM419]MDX0480556.1 hypothetical protein [Sinorhizobium medicae]MDX0838029.1 hypothetical protein [Sinorhizobium medicae]MDX0851371.1 hypothetical protein [Sinorhizobium medicae]MDX0898650.1 hypothetical protein [Sinorhizobium medicae]
MRSWRNPGSLIEGGRPGPPYRHLLLRGIQVTLDEQPWKGLPWK